MMNMTTEVMRASALSALDSGSILYVLIIMIRKCTELRKIPRTKEVWPLLRMLKISARIPRARVGRPYP
ncbi:hypothetical protein D3C74_460900 [compost metagenome]